jgi:hypothetical protein
MKRAFCTNGGGSGLYRTGPCSLCPFIREGNDKGDADRSICKLRIEEALFRSKTWLFRLPDLDANVETDGAGVWVGVCWWTVIRLVR